MDKSSQAFWTSFTQRSQLGAKSSSSSSESRESSFIANNPWGPNPSSTATSQPVFPTLNSNKTSNKSKKKSSAKTNTSLSSWLSQSQQSMSLAPHSSAQNTNSSPFHSNTSLGQLSLPNAQLAIGGMGESVTGRGHAEAVSHSHGNALKSYLDATARSSMTSSQNGSGATRNPWDHGSRSFRSLMESENSDPQNGGEIPEKVIKSLSMIQDQLNSIHTTQLQLAAHLAQLQQQQQQQQQNQQQQPSHSSPEKVKSAIIDLSPIEDEGNPDNHHHDHFSCDNDNDNDNDDSGSDSSFDAFWSPNRRPASSGFEPGTSYVSRVRK